MDIPNYLIFGFNPPPVLHPEAKKLKLRDPRVVKKIHRNNPLLAEEYEEVMKRCNEYMKLSENKCRKLRCEEILWSPTYKLVMDKLLYGEMRKNYKLGLHKNVRQFITLQHKFKIVYNGSLSLIAIIDKIKETHAERKKIKTIAESLGLEYRHRLVLAKEDEGEMKSASYLKNINRVEPQRRIYRNIWTMEKKWKGENTARVNITKEDGTIDEFNTEKPMKKVMLASNETKWHPCEVSNKSDLLKPALLNSLGSYGEGQDVIKVLDGLYTYSSSTSDDTKDFIGVCTQHPIVPTLPDRSYKIPLPRL